MKGLVLAIVQVISGAMVMLFSWLLAQVKARVFNPPPESLYYMPPDCSVEFVLVFFGLVIVICGYLQRRIHAKFAGLQMIFGLIITIVYTALGIRAATLGHLEYSAIYYVVYVLLIPGLAVSLLGIVQLVTVIINRSKTNSSK
ncbi:MAG TPA: hypothetical protein VGA85_00065 [Dehalococcoidales bacterium]